MVLPGAVPHLSRSSDATGPPGYATSGKLDEIDGYATSNRLAGRPHIVIGQATSRER